MARVSILTSVVVAAEWPDLAFSFLSCWPRSGPSQHSRFYRGGCGVARSRIFIFIVYRGGRGLIRSTILISIVVAAE